MEETIVYAPSVDYQTILLGQMREEYLNKLRELLIFGELIYKTLEYPEEKTVIRAKIW